ncbi:MAG TPA: ADOP family duplicated permease [Dokdonella sp.]|uniref:ADOP family duplicated permease n=1 Tax=Dokdonella sp. TaxID=2291710 RepID=UPI002C045597|nr:ADOP family duplicated permease [Dokdonella sp.]HUD40657.1 ADOP family duplicated permease [Dokdonella sp.]
MALRYALRSLQRAPAFTLAVVLTLAVGVAAVGSMFAIVYGVLLAPLPYEQPDRLVSLRMQTAESGEMGQPPALQVTYAEHARTLDGVGFYRTGSSNLWIEGSDSGADSVIATWVSASMMPLLGVSPLLGRSFTEEEELRGGPDAAILSEAEWRSRFDAAPDVVGKTVMVNSVSRQIVGVMPARFSFPTADTRIWLPAKRSADASVGEFAYTGVARLASGVGLEQARHELAGILPRIAESFPRLESGAPTTSWLADLRPAPIVEPLAEYATRGIAGTLWMLAAAAALVWLVAWASVANLLLIRADVRQPELAVRAVLGADRLRTVLAVFAEALVLGTAAAAFALLLMAGAVRALVAFGPAGIPRLAELGVGLPAVAFVALITAIGTVFAAVVPMGRLRRAQLAIDLRDGGRGASTGKSGSRFRAAVTALQIAIALSVTIGAALLMQTAQRLHRVDPGFDAAQVTTLRTQLPFARYDEAAAVAFYARLAERVRELPGIDEAGLAMRLPLGSGTMIEQTFRTGPDGRTRALPVNVVDDGYFAAMSIPMLAGRGFRRLDLESGTNLVISRAAAATLFADPAGTASVGKQLALADSGPVYTVIGVVGDVRDRDLAQPPSAMVYRPLAVASDAAVEPAAPRNMALLVRSSADAAAILPTIRRLVNELDATVPLYGVAAMNDVIRAATARLELLLALMTTAAAIALMLGTLGLYGVMAYTVALREREFGVRGALGAAPQRIASLVLAQGLTLTATGVAGGFLLYALTAPFLRAFLFEIEPGDPATLAAATLVLIGAAALASWLPARRAARIDPLRALQAR